MSCKGFYRISEKTRGGFAIKADPFEKAEKALGVEGLKQLKKQVVAESKLTPSEKAALTRRRKKKEGKLKERANITQDPLTVHVWQSTSSNKLQRLRVSIIPKKTMSRATLNNL